MWLDSLHIIENEYKSIFYLFSNLNALSPKTYIKTLIDTKLQNCDEKIRENFFYAMIYFTNQY